MAHTAVPQRGRAGQTALLPHVHGWRMPVATVAVPSRQREHEGFEGPRRAVPGSRGRDVRGLASLPAGAQAEAEGLVVDLASDDEAAAPDDGAVSSRLRRRKA